MSVPTLFLNTSAVKWTPTGGTLVALTRITQAGLTFNADVINNRADLDIYDSSAHIVGWKPTVTFAGLNIGVYLTLVSGLGAISWQIGNADETAGPGSIVFTMNPSMLPLGDYSGPYAQYATGNLSFMGLAADGQTNPLTYSIVSSGSFATTKVGPNLKGVGLARYGMPFLPKLATVDIPADRPVDAIVAGPEHFGPIRNTYAAVCRMQVESAKILNIDPDQVSIRAQGAKRIMTASSDFTIKFPKDHDLTGQHRLLWKDRGDGVILGYLTDDAKEDEEAA